jgi:integrase
MATFRRRGDRWQAQVRKPGAAAQSASFDTKAAAQRWARRIEHDIDEGKARGKAVVPAMTIRAIIERYEREVEPHKPIGRTKLSALRILKQELGAIKLRSLDAERIIDFAKQRAANGTGGVTIGIYLSYLGTILRTAKALWQIGVTDAPVREAREALAIIGLTGRSKERDRRPTADELEALFAYWNDMGIRYEGERQLVPMIDLCQFAIATAMRLGEICRIEWMDLDQAKRTVIIRDRKDPRQKKGNNELVPLLDVNGYDALELIVKQDRATESIFPYKASSVSTLFTRACVKLGIDDLNFHDLRHEGTSRLFEAGLRIEQVAMLTGHKDWRTLKRYTQLKPMDILAAFPAK